MVSPAYSRLHAFGCSSSWQVVVITSSIEKADAIKQSVLLRMTALGRDCQGVLHKVVGRAGPHSLARSQGRPGGRFTARTARARFMIIGRPPQYRYHSMS